MRRFRTLVLLLTPALWPAFAPAASVALGAADGRVQVQQVPAQRQMTDDERALEQRFRATYYYSLACLARQQGLMSEAEQLLDRAAQADPASRLLRQERAELLEGLGRDAQAALLWQSLLDETPADGDLRRRLARAYARLDKLDLARALFANADGSDPSDPESLRLLVGLDMAGDDLASAEKRLRALIQAGGDVDDREMLAVILQRQERWDESAAAFRAVCAQAPQRASAWARLSASYEAKGDSPAALAALQDGLKASPDSGLLADQLGKLQYRQGDFQDAEGAFSRLLKADPTDPDGLLHRGLSRLKLRRYADAEEDFKALGKLDAESPSQWYGLALSLMMQKKYAPAEAALNKVLALNPKAEPAWVQLAFLYERQGAKDKTLKALQRACAALPESDDLTLLLSAAYDDRGEKDKALAVLKAAASKSKSQVLRFQLAVELDKAGRFPEAEALLTSLVADAPKDARALNYLGYSWADRGEKLPEAEALIRRALDVDPNNHYYLDSLGWALHRQDRDAEAEAALAKAAAGIGDDADADEAVVLEHLAAVQDALGHRDDAKAALARAERIRKSAAERAPAAKDDDPGDLP